LYLKKFLKKRYIKKLEVAKLLYALSNFPPEYIWYNRSQVKSPNLPNVSFTSPGFIKFVLIQDMVWMNFSVSGLKLKYIRRKNSQQNLIDPNITPHIKVDTSSTT